MKIGITTFHWTDNYGAVLQAQALQSFLESRGHMVEIVDCHPSPATFARRWLAKTPKECVRKWEAALKRNKFERFRKKHLTRTPEVFHSATNLQKLSDRFDYLIAGSDQIWNPRWLEEFDWFWDLYFLTFAGDKTKRISYAASIGHAGTSTLTEEWMHQLKERMATMDAISVREKSSVSLIEELCGRKDAVQVADPTLLLDRSHYEMLAGVQQKRSSYLFSYMLHGLDQDFRAQTAELSSRLKIPTIWCDAQKSGLHPGFVLPAPTGWIRDIRDASYVVTNSFHATVFCLIFHVPFLSVLIDGAIGSMNSRIVDLLNLSGISHRKVLVDDAIPEEAYRESIDWARVDEQLAALKARGVDFLVEQGL